MWATDNLCCRPRTTALTGQTSYNSKVFDNTEYKNLPNSLPMWLQDDGYCTGFTGKSRQRVRRDSSFATARLDLLATASASHRPTAMRTITRSAAATMHSNMVRGSASVPSSPRGSDVLLDARKKVVGYTVLCRFVQDLGIQVTHDSPPPREVCVDRTSACQRRRDRSRPSSPQRSTGHQASGAGTGLRRRS